MKQRPSKSIILNPAADGKKLAWRRSRQGREAQTKNKTTDMTNPLLFYSTNGKAPKVDLRTALIHGQAPDRGLYLPESIPTLDASELANFPSLSYPEIATRVLSRFTPGILDSTTLKNLCEDAYDYPVPVEKVYKQNHILRLDRGPTASFKDFAARMMARLLGRFIQETGGELVILTATSGDTGSAVASAFHHVPGIRVLVLFPVTEVSDRQRKQMTTLKGNIHTIAIHGKFDDCQALVKRAFADPSLSSIPLSSANSINIGRLLPQMVYYFYAASRVAQPGEEVIFSVPSGNFGNMMGAVLARRMGLPIHRLVIPVNANDEFPTFLATGDYHRIEPSRNCLSNAMNVGHPSNLARLVALYKGHMDEKGMIHLPPDIDLMRRDIFSVSVNDEETGQTIREVWEDHHVLLEPHGAVGWKGLQTFLDRNPDEKRPAISLETAHPAKFPEECQRRLGFVPEAPPALAALDHLPESYDQMDVDYDAFRNYLRERYATC